MSSSVYSLATGVRCISGVLPTLGGGPTAAIQSDDRGVSIPQADPSPDGEHFVIEHVRAHVTPSASRYRSAARTVVGELCPSLCEGSGAGTEPGSCGAVSRPPGALPGEGSRLHYLDVPAVAVVLKRSR